MSWGRGKITRAVPYRPWKPDTGTERRKDWKHTCRRVKELLYNNHLNLFINQSKKPVVNEFLGCVTLHRWQPPSCPTKILWKKEREKRWQILCMLCWKYCMTRDNLLSLKELGPDRNESISRCMVAEKEREWSGTLYETLSSLGSGTSGRYGAYVLWVYLCTLSCLSKVMLSSVYLTRQTIYAENMLKIFKVLSLGRKWF